jgi:hypothetical protein
LIRLVWMGAGNIALLFLAMTIFRAARFSVLDAVYWVVVAAVIGARYADITRFHGRTPSGEPATMRHFFRYLITILIVTSALWVVAHALSRLR